MELTAKRKEILLEQIKNIKNGTLFRLEYRTEAPVKAEFANMGFKVRKTVKTTTRTGVKYGNIKGVVKSILSKKSKSEASNYSWVIPNKVRFNSNTGNTYLYTAPISVGCNKSTLYEIYIPCPIEITCDYTPWVYISEDNLKALGIVQDSYWTKGDRPVNDINLNNIISIG